MSRSLSLWLKLHKALREENSILHVQGCQGVGPLVALVMALCPDNATISVENATIYTSLRRSVVISIKSDFPTVFSVETILPSEPMALVEVPLIRSLFPEHTWAI